MKFKKLNLSKDTQNKLEKFEAIEKIVNREDLIYKANNCTCNFRQFRTIRSCGRDVYIRKINLEEANELHSVILMEIIIFNK